MVPISQPTRRRPVNAARIAHRIFVVLIYVFMLIPLASVVWMSFFKDAIPHFPPSGYTLSWYQNAWLDSSFRSGFLVSLQVGLVAMLVGTVLGILAAVGIQRYPFRGSALINTVLLSPLLIPAIVAGIATYLFYIQAENWLDMDIVGTPAGLILAHICLTIPWTVRLVMAGLKGIDKSIEEAAMVLGANGLTVFLRVTLPMLRPSIVAAALFSFVVSFENLEMSLSLISPGYTTLPIAIMQYLEFKLDPTIAAVSATQIIILGIFMLITDRFVKLSQVV